MAQEDETRIPGERAETVTGRRIDNSPVLKRGAVALAVVAFVGFALWSTSGKKAKDDSAQPERIVIRQTTPFEAAKEKAEPEQTVPEVKLPTPVVEPVAEAKDELLDSARRAPVMAFSGSQKNATQRREGDSSETSANSNFLPLDGNMMSQNQENSDQQRFDGLLRPTKLEGSRAWDAWQS
jgi:type IV secretion system protein VirB10